MHDLVFIIYAFLALVLLLVASPPHFKSGNIGACVLVFWAFIGTLGFFINAIIWWDNVDDIAPVWCDIWVKLFIGMTAGIASGCLCINRRLMIISSAKRSNVSIREKRVAFWTDLTIGIVPAVFTMAIHYTRQANRYNITESFGCHPATYYDAYAMLGILLPPILIGLVSFVYGGIAIYNFASRRLQFQTVLQQSGGGLNTSRFIRLVSLSSFDMLLSVPLSVYAMAWIIQHALEPVAGWEAVHEDWYRIDTFDAAVAQLPSSTNTFLQRWLPVFAAFVYFMFFGTQEDAMTTYETRAWQVGRFFKGAARRVTGRKSSSASSSSPLPSRAHLPNLGSAIAPAPPSVPYFPGRSTDDLEHGGLSLKMTNDGEKDDSLGHKPSGIAVRVERSVA